MCVCVASGQSNCSESQEDKSFISFIKYINDSNCQCLCFHLFLSELFRALALNFNWKSFTCGEYLFVACLVTIVSMNRSE